MYPFSQSVTPAVRSHLDAQVSFFNAMSQSMSRTFQNLCQLNMQLGQTMLEESSIAGQQLLTTEHATDALSIAASRAQPAADKLRAYQQHVSRVVADAQIELAQVTEQHAPVAARTARELADEVAKVASDETEKSTRKQQEIMKSFRDPFLPHGAARANGSNSAHGNMQSAGVDADTNRNAGFQGGEQNTTATPQTIGKQGSKQG